MNPFRCAVFLSRFRSALLPLLTPLIIMGGILGGIFTPTEAAAVACLYAFLIGFFVFRTLDVVHLPKILFNTVVTTSMVFLIFCMGQVLVALLTINQVPQQITELMLSISSNPLLFLLLVNILLLIVGCFIEAGVAIIILVPILAPVAVKMGIDPSSFRHGRGRQFVPRSPDPSHGRGSFRGLRDRQHIAGANYPGHLALPDCHSDRLVFDHLYSAR